MFRNETLGDVRVTSGHHPTDDPAFNSWIIETGVSLSDRQATALKNMQGVINGIKEIKQLTHKRFMVILTAGEAPAEAEILKTLVERFLRLIDRQTAQQSTTQLAVNSEVSAYGHYGQD